jgi:hypothetical protein
MKSDNSEKENKSKDNTGSNQNNGDGDTYYFGGLKKENMQNTPVYGWPGP